MDHKLLKKYKNQYANPTIQRRAGQIIFDDIDKRSDYQYRFSYQGSQPDPYQIEVIQNNKTLLSSCSCPYNLRGLCKHEVAAIDYILGSSEIAPQNTKKTKVHREFLLGKDHKISSDILQAFKKEDLQHDGFSKNLKKEFIEIEKYTPTKIETRFIFWPQARQQISYDAKENMLTMKCSCKTSGDKICTHIPAALEQIVSKYGPMVFDPDYFKEAVKGFLQEYDLSEEDDYQEFFEFTIDERGFKAMEKVKNIVPSLEEARNNFLPQFNQESKDAFLVNRPKEKITETHGIGFCIEFYDEEQFISPHFFPFVAKYKKHSRDFISSFRRIDNENLFEKLKGFSKKDRDQVLSLLEFEQANQEFYRLFDLESLKECSLGFEHFKNACKKYQVFTADPFQKLTRKNLIPLDIKTSEAELIFQLTEQKHFFTLKPLLKIEETHYLLHSKKIHVAPYFCKQGKNLYPFKSRDTFVYVHKFLKQGELNFQKKHKEKLYEEILAPLAENFEIQTTIFEEAEEKTEDIGLKKQLFLSDFEGEFVLLKPGLEYPEKLILLHSKERRFDNENQQFLNRNEALENTFLEELKELHPAFENQNPPFLLSPDQLIQDEWLLKASEKMKHQGIEIFGANDLKSFKYSLHKATVSMSIKSDIDWFDLAIEVKFGNEKVSLKEIRKALLKKSHNVQLNNGNFGLLPEKWLRKFGHYFKAGEVKKDSIQLSPYQFNIIDELHEDLEQTPQFLLDLQEKKKQLQDLQTGISVKPPKKVKASLRPYQLEGLNWLAFLHENKLGGCLADDMGLGKTLQTIAFLSHLKEIQKKSSTHLVIAPTSLVFNWEQEIHKFCPSLKTLIYTGVKRHSFLKEFNDYDVVLSTYGSLLNDIEELKEFKFGYVILDESQAIKNPNSKRYKAARLLKSENRLALTGTPIENNTFDLYAQMNFLNPGLLGSMGHFRKEFSEAIDKQKNEEASQLLGKIIYPFLLRRTKEQVAKELPEKTETILYCDMQGEQRKIYESFKEKFRDYLMQKIDENGIAKSQFYVLEGLTKLRQICNSPELLNDEEDYGKASVKLDVLSEHIKNKTARHKIVVFSQFTSMLSLVKDRLEEEGILYTYLDGKSKNREEIVTNFQENENIRVFLISLKAGGVGLNLTAADYVFLIDPWWNPAVESQAIDRCYRIGQEKHVMAYRMICKDTVEEKIVKMQTDKKKVSSSIIQTDMAKKAFNSGQIKELFN